MQRSGSSVRLDRSQHEELLLNLDPGLLMQAAQRQSSNGLNTILSNNNNNFNNNQNFNNYSNTQSFNNSSSNGFGNNNDDDYESSVESYYSPSASGGHLSPTSAHDQSPARKASGGSFRKTFRGDRSPLPVNKMQRMTSLPLMMAPSPSLTPRFVRRNDEDDLESLASTITSASSRSDHGHRSKKKTKKNSKAETTLNMSTQVLPYVNSAMELAAGQLGTGTSLRKVSVVRQSHSETTGSDSDESSSRGIFGRKKKKSKKEDSQTALVFSFSNADFSKNYNDFLQEAATTTNQKQLNRQESERTICTEASPTPKISVTDFAVGDEPICEGRMLQRYDSDSTLTSIVARSTKYSVSTVDSKYIAMDRPEADFERPSSTENDGQRKRTLDHLMQQQFQIQQQQQQMQNQMLNPLGNRFSSDNRSIRSFRSTAGSERPTQSSAELTHNGKTEKEKKLERSQRFWDYWTMISSIIYAIATLVVAVIVYLIDLFVFREGTAQGAAHLSEILNVVLAVIGSAWIIWLIFDINKYTDMMRKYWQNEGGSDDRQVFKLVEGDDGELLISIPISSSPQKLPQYYCFSTGRHSGSFFLKSGATLFCLGHIIHIVLNMIKQLMYFFADGDSNGCGSVAKLVFQFVQPVYVLLQLYMMFKYSNVIVNRSKGMARFAFMHCIATSLSFWIYTIINETVDYMTKKYLGRDKTDCSSNHTTETDDEEHEDRLGSYLRASDDYTCKPPCVTSSEDYKFEINIDCLIYKLCTCHNSTVDELLFDFGDYLYPFSIEFSILIVGVWYIMWSNIGNVVEHKDSMEFFPSPRRSFDSGTGKPTNDALYINADCHSSVKGIFLGLCHLALCFVGTIVYLVFYNTEDFECETSRNINDVIECILLGSMIGATIWVYIKIAHLDINPHPINFLDDLLLFICIPSFFMYCLFSAIPGLADGSSFTGNVITNTFMIVQVCIQTPMIVDGLRRCCDGQENQQQKPGRNLVTFLLVANLSLYIWDTLEAKSDGYGLEQKHFYGAELWAIIKHMTLPLCIFYRFHSAVALADIWNSAYKPGDHH